MTRKTLTAILTIIIIIFSCSFYYPSNDQEETVKGESYLPPIVNICDDIYVKSSTLVNINASICDLYDDESSLDIEWEQISGDKVILYKSLSKSSSFYAPDNTGDENETLTFQIRVSNSKKLESFETVNVFVLPN